MINASFSNKQRLLTDILKTIPVQVRIHFPVCDVWCYQDISLVPGAALLLSDGVPPYLSQLSLQPWHSLTQPLPSRSLSSDKCVIIVPLNFFGKENILVRILKRMQSGARVQQRVFTSVPLSRFKTVNQCFNEKYPITWLDNSFEIFLHFISTIFISSLIYREIISFAPTKLSSFCPTEYIFCRF